ncbi:hypothetical protein ACHQM5_003284 [Ranunculus cassubicifolius]
MEEFREFLYNNDLTEAISSGLTYTWTNKRMGAKKIYGKIDRMIVNEEWLLKYTGWSYKVLSRAGSDHSPLIGWTTTIPKPKNAPFRFFKAWTSHPLFIQEVQKSWQMEVEGNPLFVLTKKLKRLKSDLKSWNVSGNKNCDVSYGGKNQNKSFSLGGTAIISKKQATTDLTCSIKYSNIQHGSLSMAGKYN